MDIEALQAAAVTQLNGAFAGTLFSAQEVPDVDADYQRAVPNPIVFVVYTGSENAGIVSTDPVIQRRRLKFNLECYSRTLKGDNGMIKLREVVESAMIGYKLPKCDRLYLVKDDVGREDSIWSHVYNVECLTMLVQTSYCDPVIVPAFKGIVDGTVNFSDDYNEDFGEGDND